jgi:preprotein translocase subunit YajC
VLISNAWAQAAPAAADASGGLLGHAAHPVDVRRPVVPHDPAADEAAKEHQKMVSAMQKGDEVLTNGGIAGRVTKVGETYIGVEIAENVVISVQKNAVTAILPKGTLKTL